MSGSYEYRMNKEQFEEMNHFYRKLGYTDKQVKKLCSSCFNTEIIVDDDRPYNDDWTFHRSSKRTWLEKKSRMPGLKGFGARGIAESEMLCDEGVVEEVMMERCAPMPPMAMAAQMSSQAMMGMGMAAQMNAPGMMGMAAAMPQAQFNTAETEAPDENEKLSPMDSPAAIFSANVNTASWSYIRNKISNRDPLDKSFVRIEEIINSYHYKLKKPGDNELFSVGTESGACPWQSGSELFMVGLRGKKADKKIRQNLCFLVDVSGSMDDEWVLVQMSLASIISKLGKGDVISIIAYSDETVTVEKKLDCGDLDKCVKAILKIDGIGGCTNGSEGLTNAYKFLSENYGKEDNNRVFIFTDGDFNFGITGKKNLGEFIKEQSESGIYLSIVGYGFRNFKDDKMESLARNGNGNYTFVGNPMDILDNLHDKLISNLFTIAKDVKISVELNPKYVSSYRLIGYDARALTKQEFNDTEKAVDGIGSEHNVVALIQFERGKAVQSSSNRYVNTSASDRDGEFAFIEIHYKDEKDNDLVLTKAVTIGELEGSKNKNMQAITLLAAFGLLVKDSDYKGTASKEMLGSLLEEYKKEQEITKPEKYSHLDIIEKYINS